MLDSLSISMKKYLYNDLYSLEDTHWWHKAKRSLVVFFIERYVSKNRSYSKEQGLKLLDAGCGTGKNIEEFSKFGTTWGIDFAEEAINFCKKRGLKNITRGSLERLPFMKNFFDCITALDVLEHVDDKRALKEINRTLKKSGILVLTIPAYPFLWSRWDEVLHHKRRYTKYTISQVLKKNGFRILKISYCYSFLFIPVFITRSIKNLIYKNYYPSDFLISNKFLNAFFLGLASIERTVIEHISIPFGTSIIAVAEKK